MFVSHKYKLVFLEIPRTGSRSVTRALTELDPASPTVIKRETDGSLMDYHLLDCPELALSDYLVVAAHRNPFDRLWSHWKYRHRFGNPEIFKSVAWSRYIDWACDPQSVPEISGAMPEKPISELVDIERVDFWLYFEELEESWHEFTKYSSLPLPKLIQINASPQNASFQSVYTEPMAEKIVDRFSKDFVCFGYDVNSWQQGINPKTTNHYHSAKLHDSQSIFLRSDPHSSIACFPDNVKPARSPGFVMISEGDDLILWSKNKTNKLTLNQSACLIWLLCDGVLDIKSIGEQLKQLYPENTKQLEVDIQGALRDLHNSGLIRLTKEKQATRELCRVGFGNLWPGFDQSDNYFLWMLTYQFDVILVDIQEELPDILFYSDYCGTDFDHHQVDRTQTRKIYVATGYQKPKFSECDYAFSNNLPDKRFADRNFSLPTWELFLDSVKYERTSSLPANPVLMRHSPREVCNHFYHSLYSSEPKIRKQTCQSRSSDILTLMNKKIDLRLKGLIKTIGQLKFPVRRQEGTSASKTKVSAFCCTFGRPQEMVEEAIECFLRQDYQGEKELIVLNDCPWQTLVFEHPEVHIINMPEQIPALGHKFNAAIAHCSGDVILPWDDDDIFLPWRITTSLYHLKSKGVFHSHDAWVERHPGHLVSSRNLFQCNLAITRKRLVAAGGYKRQDVSAIDVDLFKKLDGSRHTRKLLPHEIFYIYRWSTSGSYHTSGWGGRVHGISSKAAYFVKQKIDRGELPSGIIELRPHWTRDWVVLARAAAGAKVKGENALYLNP